MNALCVSRSVEYTQFVLRSDYYFRLGFFSSGSCLASLGEPGWMPARSLRDRSGRSPGALPRGCPPGGPSRFMTWKRCITTQGHGYLIDLVRRIPLASCLSTVCNLDRVSPEAFSRSSATPKHPLNVLLAILRRRLKIL